MLKKKNKFSHANNKKNLNISASYPEAFINRKEKKGKIQSKINLNKLKHKKR